MYRFIASFGFMLVVLGIIASPLVMPVRAVDIGQSICDNEVTYKPEICGDITPSNKESAANPLYGPSGILTRAVGGLSILIGVIAVIVIIIAGIEMTLSQGDSGKVKSSRDAIIYAAVGLVIAVLAQTIVRFILNRIGE